MNDLCVSALIIAVVAVVGILLIRRTNIDNEDVDTDFDDRDIETFKKFDDYSNRLWERDTDAARLYALLVIAVVVMIIVAVVLHVT